ncbi:MAG: TlpA family protein disulfide reductase [Bacteroidales bacterium]|jgi:peroxiredoxin|nr:TlpA family protein disulfide reductase [Bacteroidales bacterium]
MKKTFITISFLAICMALFAQEIPQIQLKNLNGKAVSSKTFVQNDGKPVLICFFATWCKPCVQELSTYNDLLEKWHKETGVKIVAIATDNSRSANRVAPFVESKDWDFDVFLDTNGDFKRAMNVVNEPHTFLVDGKGKIVWQHTSYLPGDEKEVYETIKKVAEGKSLK